MEPGFRSTVRVCGQDGAALSNGSHVAEAIEPRRAGRFATLVGCSWTRSEVADAVAFGPRGKRAGSSSHLPVAVPAVRDARGQAAAPFSQAPARLILSLPLA